MGQQKSAQEWGEQLLEAAKRNNLDALREAITNCPDAVHAKDSDGWTGMHWAAVNGYDEAAKILLNAGADINVRTKSMSTPLHWSAREGRASIVKLLLEYRSQKVDLNSIDKCGDTPLYEASFCGHIGVVKLLLAAGADITIKNNSGRRALGFTGSEACKTLLQDAANGKRPTPEEVGLKMMTTQDKAMARAVARLKKSGAKGWER